MVAPIALAPINDFKAFATSAGANVESQAAYELDPSLSVGFATGVANSSRLNKVWRQSSFIAAAIAQFVANAGPNVLDDGNINNFLDLFLNAKNGFYTKNIAGNSNVTLNPFNEANNLTIMLTGEITANIIVFMPLNRDGAWNIINATTGAFTVEIRTTGAAGVIISSASSLVVVSDGVTCSPIGTLSGFNRRQNFTSSGTFIVPAGITAVYVTMTGGGGGGAGGAGSGYNYGGGGGGGAAAYLKQLVSVTPGASIPITIGVAGAGGVGAVDATFNNGSAGTISSFGALLSAAGGGGGSSSVINGNGGTSGGAGGQQGGTGLPAVTESGGVYRDAHGGIGGSTLLGTGATSGHSSGNPIGYGAGGAGGRAYPSSGLSGTAGTAGLILVEW